MERLVAGFEIFNKRRDEPSSENQQIFEKFYKKKDHKWSETIKKHVLNGFQAILKKKIFFSIFFEKCAYLTYFFKIFFF